MEESLPDTMSDSSYGLQFTQAVEQQRGRVQQFVAAHREQLDRIEAELARQIERVAGELRDDRDRTAGQQRDIEQRATELRQQADELARLKQELEQSRADLQRAQAEATSQHATLVAQFEAQREENEQRAAQLTASEGKLRREQRELELRSEEYQADQDELQRLRKRLEDKSNQLDAEREELEEARAETKLQRRRIAREFQERRTSLLEELQSRRTEIEALAAAGTHEQDEALVAAQQASRDLQQRLDEQERRRAARDEEFAAVAEELEQSRRDVSQWEQRYEELENQAQTAVADGTVERLELQCRKLEQAAAAERERADGLSAELAVAERRLSEASTAPTTDDRMEDMQRRQEMLLADLRELKSQNEELKSKLETASKTGPPVAVDGESMDWESRKRRLIAALEAEADGDDPQRKKERLTIEATIRTTEDTVASKEREIAELKQLLDQQSSQVGGLAVGAAAIAAELDKDEIVRMEREKLQRLQDEWQEKLRQAEIDLSLERAKIARERAELEDRLLNQAHEQSRREASEADEVDPKKPTRGRWLSRLGLKDDDAQ